MNGVHDIICSPRRRARGVEGADPSEEVLEFEPGLGGEPLRATDPQTWPKRLSRSRFERLHVDIGGRSLRFRARRPA